MDLKLCFLYLSLEDFKLVCRIKPLFFADKKQDLSRAIKYWVGFFFLYTAFEQGVIVTLTRGGRKRKLAFFYSVSCL